MSDTTREDFLPSLALSPVRCYGCRRHVPLYIVYEEESGETVGGEALALFCKWCASEPAVMWGYR
jgi:hypothetical protein